MSKVGPSRAFAKRDFHRRWLTPWIGTLIAAFLSAIGVALTMLNSGSITSVFTNLISDIGVLVAVYYGLTGIACAWAFRKALLKRPTTLLFAGVLPFLSALFLFWVAFEVIIPAPATWTIGSVTLWAGQGVDWATALPDLIGLGLAIPFVIASGHHARAHASTPKQFLPAMRRMVIAYLVATSLLVASVALLPWL